MFIVIRNIPTPLARSHTDKLKRSVLEGFFSKVVFLKQYNITTDALVIRIKVQIEKKTTMTTKLNFDTDFVCSIWIDVSLSIFDEASPVEEVVKRIQTTTVSINELMSRLMNNKSLIFRDIPL